LYADLRKKGQPIDDIDLLIAGTAMANGLVVITQNRKHFDRITELEVEDWSE
jgi:tRNA(fMet)-specific endonuclease VapC